MALSQLELSLIAHCPVPYAIQEKLFTLPSILSEFSEDFCVHHKFPYEKMKSIFTPAFISKIQETLATQHISILTHTSPNFPPSILTLTRPPLFLFVRGMLPTVPLVSIVGSRKMTSYGAHTLHTLVPPLVAAGCGIVSGLAFGVDALAHDITVQNQGYTVAILPSGITSSHLYPQSHFPLAQKILTNGGLLISQFPLFHKPRKHEFLERNRLIAAYSSYTLIIEASLRSGSLSTAKHAQTLGKPLGSIPARITDRESAGCLSLIANGAFPVTSPADILHHFSLSTHSPQQSSPDPILQHLLHSPCTLEELANLTALSLPILLENLTMLELAHKVSLLPDGKYTATS